MESAWTLNETCRFRIQTPEQYDASVDNKGKKKILTNRKLFSLSSATLLLGLLRL